MFIISKFNLICITLLKYCNIVDDYYNENLQQKKCILFDINLTMQKNLNGPTERVIFMLIIIS